MSDNKLTPQDERRIKKAFVNKR
ncbi:MAG: hypothetical protein RL160_1607, partial [Bacteroidota bacterium]